jgi:COP9 signalosome complex subunit 12
MLYKVTHRYYLGMLSFLNEEFARVSLYLFHSLIASNKRIYIYIKSEQELTLAFYNCHVDAHSNQEYV